MIEGTFPALKMTNLSISCNHCINPACIPACPVEAISKDSEYGIVQSDRSICISCGSCEAECPWEAPQYYDKNYADYAEDAVTSTANFNNIEKIKLHKPNLLLTAKYATK